MHPQKRAMAWINVIGGIAVLGSYAQGILSHPSTSGNLWGDVPEGLRPVYGLWMFVAAAGYLTFTHLLFFRTDAQKVRVAGRFGFGLFNALYVAILLPSALWMPLTFQMLARPSDGLWVAIRLVLWTVGLASVALVLALSRLQPRQSVRGHRLAVAGSVGFAVQTALLDAIVWTTYFPA